MQCYFFTFSQWHFFSSKTPPKNFAPFGGEFDLFWLLFIQNYIMFLHLCPPQAIFKSIFVFENSFLTFFITRDFFAGRSCRPKLIVVKTHNHQVLELLVFEPAAGAEKSIFGYPAIQENLLWDHLDPKSQWQFFQNFAIQKNPLWYHLNPKSPMAIFSKFCHSEKRALLVRNPQ